MTRFVAVGLVLALSGCASIPGLSAFFPASLDGDWIVVRPGFSSFTMTLFDENGKLHGASQAGGAIEGSYVDSKITLLIAHQDDGRTMYSGELSKDRKKITGQAGSDLSDTFIANKKP